MLLSVLCDSMGVEDVGRRFKAKRESERMCVG